MCYITSTFLNDSPTVRLYQNTSIQFDDDIFSCIDTHCNYCDGQIDGHWTTANIDRYQVISKYVFSSKVGCSCSKKLTISTPATSCAGGRHNMSPPHASWPLTFWPQKWCPSHVRTYDVGYLCANFSLPRPLCSWLRLMYASDRQTDVTQTDRQTDRQTDVRRASSLNPPTLGAEAYKWSKMRLHQIRMSLELLSPYRSKNYGLPNSISADPLETHSVHCRGEKEGRK